MLLLVLRCGFALEIYEQVSISHLLERIGLCVVIGEAFYLSVTGLAEHPPIGGATSAMFGFVSWALLARAFFRWAAPITESGLAAARNARSYGAMRDVVMYFPLHHRAGPYPHRVLHRHRGGGRGDTPGRSCALAAWGGSGRLLPFQRPDRAAAGATARPGGALVCGGRDSSGDSLPADRGIPAWATLGSVALA